MRTVRSTVTAASVALFVALALAACAQPAPVPSSTPGASSSPRPTPSSSPTDDADPMHPDVLFVISVTATSPSGAIADLVQTVYRPTSSTTTQAADEAALDAECGSWRTEFPTARFVVSTMTVTDRSPAGASWGAASPAVVSMNGWPVFTGSVTSFQAPCASVQLGIGSARGVTPVAAGDPDAVDGWARVAYGFGIATDPSFDLSTTGPYVTLSNCSIEVSTFATDNSETAEGWADAAQVFPLYQCMFGEAAAV
jgi:hypothetical protein